MPELFGMPYLLPAIIVVVLLVALVLAVYAWPAEADREASHGDDTRGKRDAACSLRPDSEGRFPVSPPRVLRAGGPYGRRVP